jgi:beta-glucuronidase
LGKLNCYKISGKLYPHTTFIPVTGRERFGLNGIWKFKADKEERGVSEKWCETGYDDGDWWDIRVPMNWNFAFRDYDPPQSDGDYEGTAWYRLSFTPPSNFTDRFVKLYFGAVGYKTQVWINGSPVGEHEGDFLPFEFDVSDKLDFGRENLLALRIETLNEDSTNTVPLAKWNYDFWIYSGIHREVYLECTPPVNIHDVYAHSQPSSTGAADASVEVTILNIGRGSVSNIITVYISEEGGEPVAELRHAFNIDSEAAKTVVFDAKIPNPKVWGLDNPNLYDARVDLKDSSGKVFDSVKVHFGIRKIEVKGTQVLLNGEPVIFRGVSRHDEYPLMGRVQPDWVYVKDLEMMKKANINAIRTGHYPNNPRIFDLTDRIGFLVFQEIPAVGLRYQDWHNKHVIELSKDYVRRMVQRDRNHPSIVIWGVGNEPRKGAESVDFTGLPFFNKMLMDEIRALDSTRLVTYAREHHDFSFPDFGDIICKNSYHGWYTLEVERTKDVLDSLRLLYPTKPIIYSEFGAGAIKDYRTNDDPENSSHYSEDFQCWNTKRTWEILNSKDYIAGGFIWLYADFLSPVRATLISAKTPSGTPNPIPYYNLKGIVTSYRVPKNLYLTVAGMYGDMPVHNLTIRTVDESGGVVKDAIVNLHLEDGICVGNQKTDAEGKTVLWWIPARFYKVSATIDNLSGSETLSLFNDETLTVTMLP